MNASDIRLLYAYNHWANARTFESSASLSPEQFTRDLASSFLSVRDTLCHIVGAEWIWLRRWKGTSPKALLDPTEFPNLASIERRWDQIRAEQEELVANVTDENLARVMTYVNTKGEQWSYSLGHMMQHVVNHSSYHRGQIATMLRQLGAKPFSTDLLLYFDVVREVRP